MQMLYHLVQELKIGKLLQIQLDFHTWTSKTCMRGGEKEGVEGTGERN